MKFFRFILKAFGVYVFVNMLILSYSFIALFVSGNHYSSTVRADQAVLLPSLIYFSVNLLLSVLLIWTPKWLLRLTYGDSSEIKIDCINEQKIIKLASVIIGFDLLSVNLSKPLTFLVKYIIAFNSSDSEIEKRVISDLMNQIGPAIALVIGLLLVIFADKIGMRLTKEKKQAEKGKE